MSEGSPANEAAAMLERILSSQERLKQMAHEKSEADRAHYRAQCELAHFRYEFTRLVSPFLDREALATAPLGQRVSVIG